VSEETQVESFASEAQEDEEQLSDEEAMTRLKRALQGPPHGNAASAKADGDSPLTKFVAEKKKNRRRPWK
jgi:hypothetical protein